MVPDFIWHICNAICYGAVTEVDSSREEEHIWALQSSAELTLVCEIWRDFEEVWGGISENPPLYISFEGNFQNIGVIPGSTH